MSLQMSHAAAIIADSAAVEAVVAARASTGILSVASSESKPRGEVIALSWARELLAGNDTVPAGSTELAVAHDVLTSNPDSWLRDTIKALLARLFERNALFSRVAEVETLGIDRVDTFKRVKV